MQELFFPFDKIKYRSKVVLYGAGFNAKKLWEINERTKWCDIIACVDRNHEKITDFPCEVTDPLMTLDSEEYDHVLISLLDERLRGKIAGSLPEMGVPRGKIVNSFLHTDKGILFHESGNTSAKLKIGFHPMGVIGDCIISLKVYQELVRLSEEKCEIDILNEYNARFMDRVFYGQKCLNEIVDGNGDITAEDLKKYDLVVDVRFEPSVSACDMGRLEEIATRLSESIKKLISYQLNDYVDLPVFQYANKVLVDRAKYLGLNRYTLFNISGAFDIRDRKVDFFINESYKAAYRELGLDKPYITYNFGANDQHKDGSRQTKMWPYEYHVKLNSMIKDAFPDIELIQLGSAKVEKIPGADRYILGQDLEVVKYILKGALLHFDCEGGLMHMASQLGTKCFVVFGPTPVWFLGYEENENICPEKCGECKGLVKDWYTRCIKYDRPECMYSIKPEYVFDRISRFIKSEGKIK